MKAIFVFLVVVAVASAAVPARVVETSIIDDILAVRECLQNVVASVNDQINGVLAAVQKLQDIVDNTLGSLQDCIALVNPINVAQCIMDVTDKLQQDIGAAILEIQQSIAGILGIPDDIAACFAILGRK